MINFWLACKGINNTDRIQWSMVLMKVLFNWEILSDIFMALIYSFLYPTFSNVNNCLDFQSVLHSNNLPQLWNFVTNILERYFAHVLCILRYYWNRITLLRKKMYITLLSTSLAAYIKLYQIQMRIDTNIAKSNTNSTVLYSAYNKSALWQHIPNPTIISTTIHNSTYVKQY
jgi:hypothetical protein